MNYGSGTGRTLGLGAVVAIAVTSGPMADSAGATSPPPIISSRRGPDIQLRSVDIGRLDGPN